jgi:GntR family transcriptional repressor for pyruvate dehydrogenase complex
MVQYLAERLRTEILTKGLSEDDVFMTEAQISARHGISRSITREAVSRLRALGILKSRQGKGLLVDRADSIALLAKTLPFSARSPQAYRHLGELRYVLELGAVDLAVTNATAEQVARLADLAEAYADASPATDGAIEFAFHSLILEMTANPWVSGLHQVIAEYFRSAAPPPPAPTSKNVWEHRAIAAAFRKRDAELARSLLRQHLTPLLWPADAPSTHGGGHVD